MNRLSTEQKEWLDGHCNGTISHEDFARMEAALLESPEFRRLARRYLAMDSHLHAGTDSIVPAESDWKHSEGPVDRRFVWWGWAAVAAIAFLIGISVMIRSRKHAVIGSQLEGASDACGS